MAGLAVDCPRECSIQCVEGDWCGNSNDRFISWVEVKNMPARVEQTVLIDSTSKWNQRQVMGSETMRGFLTDVTADEVLDGVGYLGAFDSGSKLQRQHFRMVTQPPDQRQSNNISKLFSRFFEAFLKLSLSRIIWRGPPSPPPSLFSFRWKRWLILWFFLECFETSLRDSFPGNLSVQRIRRR